MKHFFIINPAAGKGEVQKTLETKISEVALKKGIDYEIYKTTSVGDAEKKVRKVCTSSCDDDIIRFYACGGDGTLNEVVNGAVGFSFAEIAAIPVGTGNDFCRNFGKHELFENVEAQIDGNPIEVDALKYNERYCVNVMNMGFDCSVVETVSRIKRRALIPAKFAYIAGVICELVKMPGVNIRQMFIDGKKVNRDKLLLCTMANGSFYGGGFKPAPLAYVDDSTLDMAIVKPISRLAFISMVGGYQKGTYLDDKRTMKFVSYHKCKNVDIDFESEQSFCVDGEIEKCRNLHVEVVSKMFKFSLPNGIEFTPFEKVQNQKPVVELGV